MEKSGQKAKLDEIKRQSASSINETNGQDKPKKKSYAKDMKELLNKTLNKKNKQR